MRLPRTLVFPFDYRISFKYVTRAEMKEVDGTEEPPDGLWDCATRTIYVLRRLPARRLRYVIGHEMDHAVNDYRLHCVNEGIAQG
jgi:hypothetical protein